MQLRPVMMKEDLYSAKLAWFKENESPEAVLVVADDPERIKIVVAWTNLDIRRTGKLTELRGESESEIWEWLWENARYSLKELIDKIGISFSTSGLESKLRPLIGNRILYPDGTVNSYVQRYLRERVLSLFDARPKRAAKKS